MVTGPSLVALSPATLAGAPFAGEVDTLLHYLNLGITLTLIVVVVIATIEIVRDLYRLFTRRTSPAFPIVKSDQR
jgi:hypothetical protein